MVGIISPINNGAAEAAPLPSWFHLVGAPNSLRQQAQTGCVPIGNEPGHEDSWGIGWFDAAGEVSLLRQTGSAADSGYYVIASEAAARGGAGSGPARTLIGHLRKASMGAVTSENSHPVRVDCRKGMLLVAHNGTVRVPLLKTLREDLEVAEREEGQGSDNDTVVLANWLAMRMETAESVFAGLAGSLRLLMERSSALAAAEFDGDETKCYTALNLMIAHTDGLFALRQFSREPEYYTLYSRPLTEEEHSGGVVVGSERTDDHASWELLKPGELTWFPAAQGESVRTAQIAVS